MSFLRVCRRKTFIGKHSDIKSEIQKTIWTTEPCLTASASRRFPCDARVRSLKPEAMYAYTSGPCSKQLTKTNKMGPCSRLERSRSITSSPSANNMNLSCLTRLTCEWCWCLELLRGLALARSVMSLGIKIVTSFGPVAQKAI
jgi:hypothetical protein